MTRTISPNGVVCTPSDLKDLRERFDADIRSAEDVREALQRMDEANVQSEDYKSE